MSGFIQKENNDYSLVPWDDGHEPGGSQKKTQMAINHNKAASKFFSIFDDLLPPVWLERIYTYAIDRARPWGAYITTREMNDIRIDPEDLWIDGTSENKEKAISLFVYRTYFHRLGAECLRKDEKRIHGVAVWCLSSGITNEVQYHIDYAELYRYETNIIHPPLYAGTCQISELKGEDMIGGDFYANLDGLEHYKSFGYKGKLKTEDELQQDVERSGDWVRISYKENRGTLHDGDFAHFSSPIKHIAPDRRRVILGLNFFSEAVGECCIRAPEHSDSFNRTVKLYQVMNKIGNTTSEATKCTGEDASVSQNKKGGSGISAKDIAKNPAMAKMFVLAAKKFKEVQEREKTEGRERT